MWDDLIGGRLLRRYKRFLADVELDSGEQITVHCPNTGAMTGCAEPGFRVWLSRSSNPKRKYAHTWELAQDAAGERICVHSALANRFVEQAIFRGAIPELGGYQQLRREQKYGEEGSRIDLLLGEDCYVEVKSVTLHLGDGLGVFPDAVSERGRRHLRELMGVAARGERAVLLFAALHTGIARVAPADQIDPAYGETLREALAAGVEVLAYGAAIDPPSLRLARRLQVLPQG